MEQDLFAPGNESEFTLGLALGGRPRTSKAQAEAGCLHELFEAQCDLSPSATALVLSANGTGKVEKNISYIELDGRANQLARYLKSHGAEPGKYIGLFFDRSELPIVAILACLKAGAAYVPIDPVYPTDRIKHIQGEADLIMVLTETSLGGRASTLFDRKVIILDSTSEELLQFSTRRLSRGETGLSPADVCYVIYTSGTTGRPKGVMAEHRNAFLYTLAFNKICGTTPEDRVYQGFSLGFDGSVEEIWMAFSNGSALLVGNSQTPKFGSELGQFLAKNNITYFSTVPTLLSTLTEAIPSLKTLVVSGEACPMELVNRWAKNGLRMLNVYGPTEATVNTTAAECIAGRPVTIGHPLPGYELYILNPDDPELKPVSPGEKGELFVGGATLARGYLRQPELTNERFITLPTIATGGQIIKEVMSETTGELVRKITYGAAPRLYRTGDLVRINEEGELEFFGRIDSQVKIRGYRVELSEIESVLMENKRILGASVKLFSRTDGLQELAAYVMVNDPAIPLDRDEIISQLEGRMPPYMIPGTLDVLNEFPMLSSGKVDRNMLPPPLAPLVRQSKKMVPPTTELEVALSDLWKNIFGLSKISVEDDFFLDLGGHSLVAAQLVTRLREESGQSVTIRDAYAYPTIRKLATHLTELANARKLAMQVNQIKQEDEKITLSSRSVFESQSKLVRLCTAFLQLVSIYFIYALLMIPMAWLFILGINWYLATVSGSVSLERLVVWSVAITILAWPTLLAVGILGKWLIIGRYRPGRYPLWGFYYFRWWLVNRLQSLSGIGFFTGTPVLPYYFRLMGAKVGSGCILDSSHASIWDLLSIGDDTSIGADTQLMGCKVEDGVLVIGSVEIGSRCFIGIHSALGLNVTMKNDSRLDDQSLLPDDQTLDAGKSYAGSPAQLAEVVVPLAKKTNRQRPLLFGFLHILLSECLAIAVAAAGLPFMALWYFAFTFGGLRWGFAALVFSVPVGFVFYMFYAVLLKKLILARAEPGIYSVESVFYLRKWLSDQFMRLNRSLLLPLYTTLYLPPWLRLMGAKIGQRAELSTVWNFQPELIDVGEESFFADGSIVGGKRFFLGHFQIASNKIGRRSFVGNSAVLPVGSSLGDNCLLGVQSITPRKNCLAESGTVRSSCTADGSEWLGSPPFILPNRPKVGNFDASVTFIPTGKLYLQRAFIDALRILIPGYLELSGLVMTSAMLYFCWRDLGTVPTLMLAPLMGLASAMFGVFAVIALKLITMGTFNPVIVPLWSMYVWLNEMLNGAYESVMSPAIGPFLGTPFVAFFLRRLGCKIGRNAYIGTTLFSEFDLVSVGDFAALNQGAVIQNHLFEDRVMKSSFLKVGPECTVGNMAVVLYDSEMERGASLGALSLLMKGETLATFTRSHGIPSAAIVSQAEGSVASVSGVSGVVKLCPVSLNTGKPKIMTIKMKTGREEVPPPRFRPSLKARRPVRAGSSELKA